MKSIRFAVFASLLLCGALAAQSGSADWTYMITTASTVTSTSVCGGGYGAKSAASDGCDIWDFACPTGAKVFHGTYHVIGQDGWQGPTGFYSIDVRAPLAMAPGASKSWVTYVWADPSLPVEDQNEIRLMWSGSGCSSQFRYALTLLAKPADITGGPAVGTVWDLSTPRDQSGIPGGAFYLPMFRTANGLEGYVFEFTATVIPEPSSLLALLAGLGGLGGMIWRPSFDRLRMG